MKKCKSWQKIEGGPGCLEAGGSQFFVFILFFFYNKISGICKLDAKKEKSELTECGFLFYFTTQKRNGLMKRKRTKEKKSVGKFTIIMILLFFFVVLSFFLLILLLLLLLTTINHYFVLLLYYFHYYRFSYYWCVVVTHKIISVHSPLSILCNFFFIFFLNFFFFWWKINDKLLEIEIYINTHTRIYICICNRECLQSKLLIDFVLVTKLFIFLLFPFFSCLPSNIDIHPQNSTNSLVYI